MIVSAFTSRRSGSTNDVWRCRKFPGWVNTEVGHGDHVEGTGGIRRAKGEVFSAREGGESGGFPGIETPNCCNTFCFKGRPSTGDPVDSARKKGCGFPPSCPGKR